MSPRPWSENKAIQCEDPPVQQRHSPEARRAVQEYKMRSSQEGGFPGAQSNYYQEPLGGQGVGLDQERDRKIRGQGDYQQQNLSPGARTRNANQLIDNYYSNTFKRSHYEGNRERTIQDLYKNKPKHRK